MRFYSDVCHKLFESQEELEKAEEELNEIEKNDKHKGLIIFMIVISVLILICFITLLVLNQNT